MEIGQDNLIQEIAKGPKRLRAICRHAERGEIARALIEYRQNRTRAAMALGISRRTLLNKIKEYGITRGHCDSYASVPSIPVPFRYDA